MSNINKLLKEIGEGRKHWLITLKPRKRGKALKLLDEITN